MICVVVRKDDNLVRTPWQLGRITVTECLASRDDLVGWANIVGRPVHSLVLRRPAGRRNREAQVICIQELFLR